VAIDLFCYSDIAPDGCERILDTLRSQQADIFEQAFLVSKVNMPSAVAKEIATEHNLAASASFLVALNEKNQSHRLAEVANLLKSSFGVEHLVVLQDNEVAL